MDKVQLLRLIKSKEADIREWHIENWSRLSIANQLDIRDQRSRTVLYEYIEKIAESSKTTPFGHKNAPYYEGEDFDIPEYTWEGLSKEEKAFYKIYKEKKDDQKI